MPAACHALRLSIKPQDERAHATGDYAFEPPGEVHTLVVPEDVQEMRTLFHVTGGYIYVDPYGEALSYQDVFTKIEAMRAHFENVGLGAAYADRFIK